MYNKLICILFSVFLFGLAKADEVKFNPAMDFWRQMSTTMDHKQYKGLRDLVNQNEETKKSELEAKIEAS
jgi:hypothetical protein